jgi:hypothetical protein
MRIMLTTRRALAVGVLAAVVTMVAATGADAAAPADKQKELVARKAFAEGDWKKALDLFAGLYAETLHPVYLRNIGRCHQKLREPEKAIEAFRDYLAKNKKVPAEERTEVEGYIKEMESLRDDQARARAEEERRQQAAAHPSVDPTPPPPDLRPPPPPDTGAQLTSTAPPPGAEPPVYKKWWFWTAVGAAVVGTVAAVVLLKSSSSNDCPAGVDQCK